RAARRSPARAPDDWSSLPAHLRDLVDLLAAGRVDRHLVAGLTTDQRARDGRRDGDGACFDVGLVGPDDPVVEHLAALGLLKRDVRAEAHLLAGELRGVDHLRAREMILDLVDARLDHPLLLLGSV